MYVVYSSLDTNEPIMLLNQVIGANANDPYSPYIDGALFQQELLELDTAGYKCIRIFINSPGGNVVEGYNICNAILKSKTPVDTYNTGMCASMAAMIFMTGRKRVMADYSSMMIHNPFGGDDAKMLAVLRDGCIKLLAGKCDTSEEEIGKMMDQETWLSPSQAFEKGFCTDIESTSETNKKGMPKTTDARALWQAANKISANLLLNNNSSNMENKATSLATGVSLIAAYLGLNIEATENSVLSAMKERINTETLMRSKAEDSLSEMKKAMDKATGDLEDMKAKYNAKVKELKEKEEAEATAKAETDRVAAVVKADADKKIKDAQEAAKKTEIVAFVDTMITTGRVKSEAKDAYVEIGMSTDITKLKAALENLPLNKQAASAQAAAASASGVPGSEVDPTKVPANAMSMMAHIRAKQIRAQQA